MVDEVLLRFVIRKFLMLGYFDIDDFELENDLDELDFECEEVF